MNLQQCVAYFQKLEQEEKRQQQQQQQQQQQPKDDYTVYCEKCHSLLQIHPESNFYLCTDAICGAIMRDNIDFTPEWHQYAEHDKGGGGGAESSSRCGFAHNISSDIGDAHLIETQQPPLFEGKEGEGEGGEEPTAPVPAISQHRSRMASSYNSRKNTAEDIAWITGHAMVAGLPKKIIDDAIFYYRRISPQKHLFRSTNKFCVLASMVEIACRTNGFQRTTKEIAAMFHIDTERGVTNLKKGIALLNETEGAYYTEDKTIFEKITPSQFIERYANRLSLGFEHVQLCRFIAMQIGRLELFCENTPASLASGILYFVVQLVGLQDKISKALISQVTDVSEVTINLCAKKMMQHKEQLVPPCFLSTAAAAVVAV